MRKVKAKVRRQADAIAGPECESGATADTGMLMVLKNGMGVGGCSSVLAGISTTLIDPDAQIFYKLCGTVYT